MSGLLWRWVDRRLARCLPPPQYRTTLGDLMEDHARRVRTHGRLLAAVWVIQECRDVARAYGAVSLARARKGTDMSPSNWARTFSNDFALAWKTLRRSRGFVIASITTLALAIGVCTAIYSALAGLVLFPLPIPDSDRYVTLWQTSRAGADSGRSAPPDETLERWRSMTHLFEAIVTYSHRGRQFIGGVPEAEMVNITELPPLTARTLGVRPAVGRLMDTGDERGSTGRVAVLSHARWQQWFGGDRDVVGRQITLGDLPFTIIGVMPDRFVLPARVTDVWVAPDPTDTSQRPPSSKLARLTPGTTPLDVKTQLEVLPETGTDVIRAYALGEELGKRAYASLFVLTGAAFVLLVIACVNVASLRIARDAVRFRDVVVLQALGATRAALVRLALIEGALIALAGGTLGMGLAWLGLQTMTLLRPVRLSALDRVTLDGDSILMVVATCVLTTLAIGLLPALSLRRANPQLVLAQSGRAVTNSRQRFRWALTVAEVALSVTLLLGATALVRAHTNMTSEPAGFEASGLLQFTLEPNVTSIPREERARRGLAMFHAVAQKVSELPGVQAVTRSSSVVPAVLSFPSPQSLEPIDPNDVPPTTSGPVATPTVALDYFQVMGIPLLSGRLFEPRDLENPAPAVVVSASLARALKPGGQVLGRSFKPAVNSTAPSPVIIGIVGDVRNHSFGEHPLPPWQIYRLMHPERPMGATFVVRAEGDAATMLPLVRQAIRAASPDSGIPLLETAEELLFKGHSQGRFNAVLLSTFTASGLVLTLVGIFGVLALFVGERRKEIGVRVALGASKADVAKVILYRTCGLASAGVLVGLLGSWWLARYLGTLLDDVQVFDFSSLGLVTAAIVVAVIAGTTAPLRSALSIDPTEAMRE